MATRKLTDAEKWQALRAWVTSHGHSCSCDNYCICGQQLDKDDVVSEMRRLDDKTLEVEGPPNNISLHGGPMWPLRRK